MIRTRNKNQHTYHLLRQGIKYCGRNQRNPDNNTEQILNQEELTVQAGITAV